MTVSTGQALKKTGPLLSLFKTEHLEKTGKEAEMNVIQAKWALADIVGDIGVTPTREAIQYFFKTSRVSYGFSEFTKVYDKIHANIIREQEDEILRAALREKTRKLVEGHK